MIIYTDNNFWTNASAKEMAVKYFPYFFEKDLSVTTKYSMDVLEKQYLKYVKKYFTLYTKESTSERFSIQMAYEYLSTILKEHKKFEVNSHIAKNILQSYKSLICSIGSYNFCPHWEDSYSDLQNKTNQKILLEISLFQPFVEGVLESIDNYFLKISEPEKIDEFYCELVKKLEIINNELDNSNSDLMNAQYDYHNTWNETKRGFRGGSTDRELGFYKKNWRFARNNACYYVLKFFKELKDINIDLCYRMLNLNCDTTIINETYNNAIEKIVHSPNYFCYLSEPEKEELSEQKALRKIQSKNNS